MGLQRPEEDHPLGPVAPQDRRRRLRGSERRSRRPGHRLRRILRLERRRSSRRSQQDHCRLLLQRPGAMRPPRRLVIPHWLGISFFLCSSSQFAFMVDYQLLCFSWICRGAHLFHVIWVLGSLRIVVLKVFKIEETKAKTQN